MSKTVWHSGPPPAIGWWPASMFGSSKAIRWWDGKNWSVDTFPNASAKSAARSASVKAGRQAYIQWSERWWITDCKHDLENPFKVGRAQWVCRECGRDISMHLFYLHEGEVK